MTWTGFAISCVAQLVWQLALAALRVPPSVGTHVIVGGALGAFAWMLYDSQNSRG